MAKIMNTRPTPASSRVESYGCQKSAKHPTDRRAIEATPPNRDEYDFVLGDDVTATLKIVLQASHCSLMKGNTPALLEFCLSDEQGLRVEIV
jgi:hypothetical protein